MPPQNNQTNIKISNGAVNRSNANTIFSNLPLKVSPLPNTIVKPPVKQRKPKVPEPNYPKCKAVYSYQASEADELNFNEGDIIYVLKKEGKLMILIF